MIKTRTAITTEAVAMTDVSDILDRQKRRTIACVEFFHAASTDFDTFGAAAALFEMIVSIRSEFLSTPIAGIDSNRLGAP